MTYPTTNSDTRPKVSDWILVGVLLLLTILDSIVFITQMRIILNNIEDNYSNMGMTLNYISILTSLTLSILFYIILLIALSRMKKNAYMADKKTSAKLLKTAFIFLLITASVSILIMILNVILPIATPELFRNPAYSTTLKVLFPTTAILSVVGLILAAIGITMTNARKLKGILWTYLALTIINILWGMLSNKISNSHEWAFAIKPVIVSVVTLALNTLVGLMFVFRRETIREE